MEKAVDYLVGHPVLFVIAVIIAIMILFNFLRRVMRLFLVIVAVLVLYAAISISQEAQHMKLFSISGSGSRTHFIFSPLCSVIFLTS